MLTTPLYPCLGSTSIKKASQLCVFLNSKLKLPYMSDHTHKMIILLP